MPRAHIVLSSLSAFVAPAFADEAPPVPVETQPPPPPAAPVFTAEEEEPELTAPEWKDVPPRYSWDVALNVSYGNMPQFSAPGWAGFGVRGVWGKHFGRHRIGPALQFTLEGPIAVQWTNNFEPSFAWDFVHEKKLWLGANLGVDLALHADSATALDTQLSFSAAPSLAFRIGFSQPFSLLRARFFIGIEPKIRIMDGKPQVLGALVIGSGKGY